MKSRLCALSEIPEGEIVSFEINGLDLIAVRVSDSEVSVFEDRCSHADVMLSGGSIENGEIECIAHGAKFCIKSGEARCMPAVTSIKKFPTSIENGELFVELS